MNIQEGQKLSVEFFNDLVNFIQTPTTKTFNNISILEEKHRSSYIIQTNSNDISFAPNLPIGFFVSIYNLSNSYLNIFNIGILPPKYTTLLIITDTGPILINAIQINPFNNVTKLVLDNVVLASDNGKCFNLTNPCTLTLPKVVNNGFHLYIKNSSNGICNIQSEDSILIDNQSSFKLLPKNSMHVIFDGSNYIILEGKTTKNLRILNTQEDAIEFRDNDFLIVNSPLTLTLPIISGMTIFIRKNFSDIGEVTICCESQSNLIDGMQIVTLDQNLETVGLICDGTNYFSYTGSING
jgi:hypothetical protein